MSDTYDSYIALEKVLSNHISPGIVEDCEKIARVLLTPKHCEDGEILAAAFTQIFNPNGMSVLRLKYEFETCLSKTIKLLENGDDNKYCGYVCANVSDIRNVKHENYRIFYILDTAREDRLGHSDVFAIRIEEIDLPKKSLNNYIRLKISEVFNELILAS